MKNWYGNLKGRFASFDEHIQVLNILSDLNKAKNLYNAERQSALNHCYRAIILLDYLLEDPKWRNKRKEVLRLREVIGSFIVEESPIAGIEQILTVTRQLNSKAYRILKNL